mmetsp:Transcript_1989/g.3862  ORF Transcript_1989/g.3862 Transcript_1989/m.3862 type:complete len:215 (-) Transcript_1989:267-911(-)
MDVLERPRCLKTIIDNDQQPTTTFYQQQQQQVLQRQSVFWCLDVQAPDAGAAAAASLCVAAGVLKRSMTGDGLCRAADRLRFGRGVCGGSRVFCAEPWVAALALVAAVAFHPGAVALGAAVVGAVAVAPNFHLGRGVAGAADVVCVGVAQTLAVLAAEGSAQRPTRLQGGIARRCHGHVCLLLPILVSFGIVSGVRDILSLAVVDLMAADRCTS